MIKTVNFNNFKSGYCLPGTILEEVKLKLSRAGSVYVVINTSIKPKNVALFASTNASQCNHYITDLKEDDEYNLGINPLKNTKYTIVEVTNRCTML